MGRKRKLKKFEELVELSNVYENYNFEDDWLIVGHGQRVMIQGGWAERHFKNNQPVVLELGCGGGEYTCALAAKHPEKNFIGIDVKGARIWKGAKYAFEHQLDNAAFLRIRIEKLGHFFAEGEVSEIWITFPDPFLKESKENRRLTSAAFFNRYRKILKQGGLIHLKTDEPNLYQFTLDTIEQYEGATIKVANEDIYRTSIPHSDLDIKTYYEQIHLSEGKQIKYISFTIS